MVDDFVTKLNCVRDGSGRVNVAHTFVYKYFLP